MRPIADYPLGTVIVLTHSIGLWLSRFRCWASSPWRRLTMEVADECARPLLYVDKEFRLVLGRTNRAEDEQALARIAPGCVAMPAKGFQLTAGHSPRFICWSADDATYCAWRLPDMPEALKRVVEDDYPQSIKLRWRWLGLGGVAHVRYVDSNGNRVSQHNSITVTIPNDLTLEFVDGDGKVLWTARAAALAGTAHR